jgi:pyridoxamine-phosphate oxidase
LFFWDALERQVRIEGTVEKVAAAMSDEYFNSRPYGSRIGALASPQSHRIPNRDVLEEKVKALQQQYPEGSNIDRPNNWGGYVLKPTLIEFWQGRASRLHDRIVFELEAGDWVIYRVAP